MEVAAIWKICHIAGDGFLETPEIARTKGESCSVLRNTSVGPHVCLVWFGFFFPSCPFSGLCALCEQKRVISDVVGLGEHADQEVAYSSCSSGSRVCKSLLSPTDPAADIIFCSEPPCIVCCSLYLGIKLGKVYFSAETWSKTWEFSHCQRKEAAACSGSSDNCSLTDLLLMAVSEEGRGRTLLQWWQHQVQLFCVLLSKGLISDREKRPVHLICFDWQWIPIL